jgi:sugar O-acyltransferase (sialic acid O-acetyltransferase NeuD family)
MRQLLIVGAGGFAAEAAWVAETAAATDPAAGFAVLGYADDDPRLAGSELYGYRCMGAVEEAVAQLAEQETWYFCAIGDNRARQAMAARCDALGLRAATLIHPSVVQSKFVRVGEGTYVGALSILNPYCEVGRHVIVNQRVAVGHHAAIGDFANLCPGAQINGHVRVGAGALIGSNASILQGRAMGDWAVVGPNSFVVAPVPAGAHVLGVPARSLALP